MRTNILNPLQSILPAVLLVPVKIMLSLIFLLYGIFNFSAHHWALIGVLVVTIMAISERISRLNATHKTSTSNNQSAINTDGGSFSQADKSRTIGSGRPVVQDGGLFNRKNQK